MVGTCLKVAFHIGLARLVAVIERIETGRQLRMAGTECLGAIFLEGHAVSVAAFHIDGDLWQLWLLVKIARIFANAFFTSPFPWEEALLLEQWTIRVLGLVKKLLPLALWEMVSRSQVAG